MQNNYLSLNPMRKVLYSLAVLVVFILTFNFTIVSKHVNNFGSLALQNIEALSYAETAEPVCYGLGSIDCPTERTKVLWISK